MDERAPVDPTGGPYRLGVIGDPVAHSLSPALHQPALDYVGLPATYERWHTTAAEVPNRIASLRDARVLGASVTVPHKLAVMGLVDAVSPAARRAGAVNTIVNRGGSLYGDNTDIHGFSVTVAEALAGRVPPLALVLGAGGAARAVVLALEAAGVGEIVVANRGRERAGRLAMDLEPAPVRPATLDNDLLTNELPRAGLLVNATSLGWHAGEMPIEARFLDLLPAGAVVADLTYRDTDLLLAAAARGLRTVDGLPMLVHQGARAFALWTGYPAPVETMLAAARAARDGG
ncbi:MAG: shikimate dehydrogenase family protein [Thermomicrobiales bacterium]